MKQVLKFVLAGLIVVSAFSPATLLAQASPSATDKLSFLNGDTKEGKVIALSTETVRFIYRGETINYEFKKREIEKIQYASGRIEWLTMKEAPETNLQNSRHRVAVLPITYMGDGTDTRSSYMRLHLQEICINYLSKSAAELQVLDASWINSKLLKHGITSANIDEYSAQDLAVILRVEYVVTGSVLQDNGSLITTVNEETYRRQRHESYGRTSNRSSRNGNIVTRQNVETQVNLSIFSETGQRIYSQSRHSLLSEQDAYKNTLQYLLKRTPLYKR